MIILTGIFHPVVVNCGYYALRMWVLAAHQAGQLAAKPKDWKKPVSVFAGMCLVCGVLVSILGTGETF